MNVDINPCYDSVQLNNQKTRITMNPSYETVQNSTSDQLQIQTRQELIETLLFVSYNWF